MCEHLRTKISSATLFYLSSKSSSIIDVPHAVLCRIIRPAVVWFHSHFPHLLNDTCQVHAKLTAQVRFSIVDIDFFLSIILMEYSYSYYSKAMTLCHVTNAELLHMIVIRLKLLFNVNGFGSGLNKVYPSR